MLRSLFLFLSLIFMTAGRPADSLEYRVITNQAAFTELFNYQGAAAQGAKTDFYSHIVVAIVSHDTVADNMLIIDRAEIIGKDLNVYYSVTPGKPTNIHSPIRGLATLPRNQSVRNVNFYENAVLRKIICVRIN